MTLLTTIGGSTDSGKDNSRVAVLQCCSSKIDSAIVKIELYIYYKYRSIFMGWEMPLENCNTATVQQIVSFVTVESCQL